jgi:hypothetical protein
MLGAAFPLIAVPLGWYVLGVCGAALHPRRVSPLTVFAVIRGAAVLIVVTWIVTRWGSQPGRVAPVVVAAAVAIALAMRARAGSLRTVVIPDRRDLPMLALATALLSAWIAPVTRHGIGSIGTGNHADLPSYLLQAVYLFDHGFAATATLPGILPEDRMFDGFGAYALLAPTTGLSSLPTIGVMATIVLGAVLLAQLVDRLSSRILDGARVAPLLIGATLLMTYAFTFNTFAFFLAQVWGMVFGVGLFSVLLIREGGPAAVANAVVVSVAGVLTYNPTGVMYGFVGVALGAWLLVQDRGAGRQLLRSPAFALASGVALGAVLFVSVWHLAFERLQLLRGAVAGWPIPTAPLWAAIGIPAEPTTTTRGLVAGSCVTALVAGAGWLASPRARRIALRAWPLAIPAAAWLYHAIEKPGTYQQWKAFSYVQPLLVIAIACGGILLVQALAARLPRAGTARRQALAAAAVSALLFAYAASNAFWPRTFFSEGGCCIASRDQIAQVQDAADHSPGRVRVNGGNVWVNDVATAVVSREVGVSIDPPSIWPSTVVEPFAGSVTFETGLHPSLVEGRFLFQPS